MAECTGNYQPKKTNSKEKTMINDSTKEYGVKGFPEETHNNY